MTQQSLPAHASVVVIGGGVMGCSTLYHLAQNGVTDAVLLERNKLTSGTTWHSAAQVRALRSSKNLTDLIRYSVDLYSRLEAETGQATGWIQKGSLSIATNEGRLTSIRRQADLAQMYDVPAREISIGEAKERWPLMNADDVIGAVWSPDDGRVSPSDVCAALVKGAKAKGAKIFENTAVKGIVTDNGKIVAVETEQGQITCDAIALCTGMWSRKNAGMAGVNAPVWPCHHYYLLTKPVEGMQGNVPTLSDQDGHLYIRDDSGGILVGCFEPEGIAIDPDRLGDDFAFQLLPEDWDHFEPMMMNALHRLPSLEHAEVKMLLNGPESFTPDSAFMLGEAAETKGLFIGTGMNSMGVAAGGGAGMCLAHNIVHGHMPYDLHEVDPKRYSPVWNDAKVLAERMPEVLGKHYEVPYPGRFYSSARNLAHSPVTPAVEDCKPHMGQFNGVERPVYFNKESEPELTFGIPAWRDNVAAEVKACHEDAALFDASTFGKLRVTGKDALTFLNHVCANDMDKKVGRAIYTAMLNERGGMESDLTALRLGDNDFRLMVGTTARFRDLAWLNRHLDDNLDVSIVDETDDYAIIGLMGPKAPAIATAVGADKMNELKYFQHGSFEIEGVTILAVRLSYMGEAGWELTVPAADAPKVYQRLRNEGAVPAGTYAQGAMRVEKGFLSYGHDLDTDLLPTEAGLGFALGWNTDFIGKDALLAVKDKPLSYKVMTVVLDDPLAVPLGHEPIFAGDKIIGKTTSCDFGYRIGKPVCLTLIKTKNLESIPEDVEIAIAGQRFAGKCFEGPAYDPKGTAMKSVIRKV